MQIRHPLLTDPPKSIMIVNSTEKAWKKRSTSASPDREDGPPAERRSRKEQMEGSFGAGVPESEDGGIVGVKPSCPSPIKGSREVPLQTKECRTDRQNKGGTAVNSPFAGGHPLRRVFCMCINAHVPTVITRKRG